MVRQKRDAREIELENLLASYADEEGSIRKNKQYLLQRRAKRILQLVIELELTEAEANERLQRSSAVIKSAIRFHNFENPWKKERPTTPTKNGFSGAFQHQPLVDLVRFLIEDKKVIALAKSNTEVVTLLMEALRKHGTKEIKESNQRLTKKSLETQLHDLIWSPTLIKRLGEFVADGIPAALFHEDYGYIPLYLIQREYKELVGNSPPKPEASLTLPGVMRLLPSGEKVRELQLKATSVTKPRVIKTKKKDRIDFIPIGATLLGLPYNKQMARNPLRCQMEIAEKEGVDAVFLTGGLMHLPLKQAHGNTANHRGALIEMDIDLAILDPAYRKTIERRLAEHPDKEVMIYQIARESFANILAGYRKIFQHEDGSPRFTIPVYIVFGPLEEDLIEAGANAEVRYKTHREQLRVRAEIAQLKKQVKVRDLEHLQEQELRDRITALESEQTRIRKTNAHPHLERIFRAQMTNYLTEMYEEAIPGAQVIGIGNSWVQMNDQIIEIRPARGNEDTPALVDGFIRSEGNHRTQSGSNPHLYILASAGATYGAGTFIDATLYTERQYIPVVAPPVLIDIGYIKRAFARRGIVAKKSPIERLVRNAAFQPGCIRLTYASGVWTNTTSSIKAILNQGGPKEKKKGRPKKEGISYINLLMISDLHSGHPWEERYYDASSGRLIDQSTAIFELLRRTDGLGRVHGLFFGDDLTQGQNFANEHQPHEHLMPSSEHERRLLARAKDIAQTIETDHVTAKELVGLLVQEALKQDRYHGRYWTQDQLTQLLDDVIDPAVDIFIDVLKTVERSGVEYLGISSLKNALIDSRDIAPLSFGNGNHWAHTVWGHLMEGEIVASHARALLRHHPALTELSEKLGSLIRAPRHGNDFIGYGHIITPQDGKIGIALRGSPSRKSSANGYPLGNMVKNVLERGDPSDVMRRTNVLHFSGDIHKGGYACIPRNTVISCAACTRGDPYGNRGFARSHVGGVITSIPAQGPDTGPVKITFVMSDFLQHFLNDDQDIVIEELLPTPL